MTIPLNKRYRNAVTLKEMHKTKVIKAFDTIEDRNVVIKMIEFERSKFNEIECNQFRFSSQASLKFNHPNLMKTYKFEETKDCVVAELEYIEGKSLGQFKRECRCNDEFVLHVDKFRRQLDDGLDYLYDRGFIHGDLHDGDIMITPSCDLVLIDFGLMRSSSIGDRMNERQSARYSGLFI